MNNQAKYLLAFLLYNFCYSETIYDVTKYGADTRAQAKSTDAIRKAIDAASSAGGGVVHFPKGQYLTGAIHLKSNITLDFADGTEVGFSTDFKDYLPMVTTRWEGTVLNNFSPLIYAYNAENIAIRGKAVLDGYGKVWWDKWSELLNTFYRNGSRPEPLQQEFLKNNNLTEIAQGTVDISRISVAFLRPIFIQPFQSKNIVIESITMRNSPFWNINPVFSRNITVRDVRIEAPYPQPNTDGIDPDSCRDVLITGAVIDVGDDCIAIKSGRDGQGRQYGIPTENLLIEKSTFMRGTAAVAIGSEQSGGVRNVTVRDCVFNGTDKGINIKTNRERGGVVENIEYRNITMTKIKYEAIALTMSYWSGLPPTNFSETTPVCRDLRYIDIRGDATTTGVLSGIEESLLKDILIKNLNIRSQSGLVMNYTQSVDISSYKQG